MKLDIFQVLVTITAFRERKHVKHVFQAEMIALLETVFKMLKAMRDFAQVHLLVTM